MENSSEHLPPNARKLEVEIDYDNLQSINPNFFAYAADELAQRGDVEKLRELERIITERKEHLSPYTGELSWYAYNDALGRISKALYELS